MKEQDIIDLGFTKEFGDNFYYYTYDLARGFGLITQASDEVVDNKWVVEVFETDEQITFTDVSKVRKLMDLIIEAKLK